MWSIPSSWYNIGILNILKVYWKCSALASWYKSRTLLEFIDMGCIRYLNLISDFKTTNLQQPCSTCKTNPTPYGIVCNMHGLVRLSVCYRIKTHAPPLGKSSRQFPWVSTLRQYSPGGVFTRLFRTKALNNGSNTHRLPRGLPGSLIPFAPHAFVPQRQLSKSTVAYAFSIPTRILVF